MSCGYEGYEFGAGYLDSACIDGYLWDQDKGNSGQLTGGPEMPCPQCNGSKYVDMLKDELFKDGYFSHESPMSFDWMPKFNLHPKLRRKMKRWWMKGRKQWGKDKKLQQRKSA